MSCQPTRDCVGVTQRRPRPVSGETKWPGGNPARKKVYVSTSCGIQEGRPEDTLDELKSNVRWAVGNRQWDPGRGKYVKRPYCPYTSKVLKTNNPEEWKGCYGDAL